LNKEEHWVRVQPGIVLDHLNLQMKPHGLQFGPDPASSNRAAMGGIVANNSTGSHSITYGMTADHVLESDVYLSDGSAAHFGPLENGQLDSYGQRSGLEGQIYNSMAQLLSKTENQAAIQKATPRHWRRCGGYNLDRLVSGDFTFQSPQDPRFNLAKLICGSEGTLAVMNEIKLNLVPTPTNTALAIIHFDGIYEALSAVPTILEVDPTAVEMLDDLAITMCGKSKQFAPMLNNFVEGKPNSILITEFYGENEAELRHKIDRLKDHLKKQGVPCGAITEAHTPSQKLDVWEVRKAGLGLLMSIRGDHKPIPFIEDSAVPVEHLADYVTKIEQFSNDLGSKVAYYAHASAGCIHIRPLINTKAASEIAKLPKISEFAIDLLHGYDGVLSSEHGDGRCRSWMNERFFGPELYGMYRETKGIFDKDNLLNPGNVVNAPAMTENMRFGADYQVVQLEEHLDFSSDQGFHRAVEMCNGAGICRKASGTMCPSFMVTKEEEHSTRGRANLLRAALSGQMPHEELTSPRMHEAMDLCIECKACKSECPSSVDMAKIKFEFLAQYHKKHGVPLRSRMMADIARASRICSGVLAPLVNAVLGSKPIAAMFDKLFGFSRNRPMPKFTRHPFTTWFSNRPQKTGTKGKVVLFNDTFNTYNYPEVSIAATELLEAAGYEVVLPGHYCCGRPMISKGLVEKARAAVQECVEKLSPFAEQDIPIIGLEPSCILTFRDEIFSLLPNEPRAEKISENCVLFEEFIAELVDKGELDLDFKDASQQVLLHGHCHQKSLAGTSTSHKTLEAAGCDVNEVDSGCCGMAGSFGYESEHYDISREMGERALLPAVREVGEDTTVVAAGVSCRQQIKQGTGRQALHPAQVLHQAYFKNGKK